MRVKEQRVRQHQTRRPFPILRYVMYLLIITTVVTGMSLSRYATSSAMDDAARVAKSDVRVTHTTWNQGEYSDVSVHLQGGTKTYTLTVTNFSEVTVRARILILSYDTVHSTMPTASGWVTLNPVNTAGNAQNVTITVNGLNDGHAVTFCIEHEQLN